jgi:hypothetical protein
MGEHYDKIISIKTKYKPWFINPVNYDKLWLTMIAPWLTMMKK